MTGPAPKLFISYSWTSSQHEEWVLSLATELRESGIDVILDKWDLKEGHDAHAFMERMVTDPAIAKVAMICDRVYAEKADGRAGGVGTETQIISAEVYEQQDQTKFVAVLPERDEQDRPFLPAYYKPRVYIDLSNPDLYARNFEQLLRWVHDKPLHVKPELGKMPAFLSDEATASLQTAARFRRASDALRQGKTYRAGALREYFDTYADNLEQFRIPKSEKEFDDAVLENIDEFLPYRNEALEIFLAISRYEATNDSWEAMHHFFERLLPYMEHPESVNHWQEWDFDNFRFIAHELFLYAVAALLNYERFDGVAHLLRQHYYSRESARHGNGSLVPFAEFRRHLRSLEHRNERLNLRRTSLHADMLEQRSKASGLQFQQVMEADFLLFIRDCIDCLCSEKRRQAWWPVTLVYSGRQYGPFEIFARSESLQHFDRTKCLLGIDGKEDLQRLTLAFKEGKLRIPHRGIDSANPFELMGFDRLATLP